MRRFVLLRPFRKVLFNINTLTTAHRVDILCAKPERIYIFISATSFGILFRKQLRAIRFLIRRAIKRRWIKVFFAKQLILPFVKKAKQIRMGKGKSKIRALFTTIQKNDLLFIFSFSTMRVTLEKQLPTALFFFQLFKYIRNRMHIKLQFFISPYMFYHNNGLCWYKITRC